VKERQWRVCSRDVFQTKLMELCYMCARYELDQFKNLKPVLLGSPQPSAAIMTTKVGSPFL
jgi:hypothetical protein